MSQAAVIAFLRTPEGHPGGGPVEVIETHGALIFLAGDVALKIKRAVRYDYLDLSTLARREATLRRELALNQPAAPMIYRDLMPVTRMPDGHLRLGGTGAPVEWVLRMWRFPAGAEMATIAASHGIDDALARDLGQTIARYHRQAPVRQADGVRLIGDILAELDRVFAGMQDSFTPDRISAFATASQTALRQCAGLLDRRARGGHVRRGHGDLHLRNIVRLDGAPVLFDALEFDEVLGTCDVLYDLAFLLMDLHQRGLARAANIALAAYLLAADGAEDGGVAALPLFCAVRAAISAMVQVQTATATQVAPGAIHLRTDTARKAASNRPEDTALPAESYTPAARAAVYDRLFARADTILSAGHAVLIDATCLDPDLRARARALGPRLGVEVRAIWLDAPLDIFRDRVAARRGDASDADVAVLDAQQAGAARPQDWEVVSAEGAPATVADRVTARLTLRPAQAD